MDIFGIGSFNLEVKFSDGEEVRLAREALGNLSSIREINHEGTDWERGDVCMSFIMIQNENVNLSAAGDELEALLSWSVDGLGDFELSVWEKVK